MSEPEPEKAGAQPEGGKAPTNETAPPAPETKTPAVTVTQERVPEPATDLSAPRDPWEIVFEEIETLKGRVDFLYTVLMENQTIKTAAAQTADNEGSHGAD